MVHGVVDERGRAGEAGAPGFAPGLHRDPHPVPGATPGPVCRRLCLQRGPRSRAHVAHPGLAWQDGPGACPPGGVHHRRFAGGRALLSAQAAQPAAHAGTGGRSPGSGGEGSAPCPAPVVVAAHLEPTTNADPRLGDEGRDGGLAPGLLPGSGGVFPGHRGAPRATQDPGDLALADVRQRRCTAWVARRVRGPCGGGSHEAGPREDANLLAALDARSTPGQQNNEVAHGLHAGRPT